ncbi:EcsC family protein [Cytobacillus sp. Hm23]
MTVTDREQQVLNDIIAWESRFSQMNPTDFELLYDKWLHKSFQLLPDDIRTEFFVKMDNWLFHLHAMIQGSQPQIDTREQIITSARLFDEDINQLSDLQTLSIDQLTYLCEQQVAKSRLYSFVQGGITGTGGAPFLGIDLPLMLIINLRAVQLIAMSYGNEINTPSEMMTALKVFHGATLPKRLQGSAWGNLLNEMENSTQSFFYEGNENLINEEWLDQPLKQILKTMMIYFFRRKMVQGIPIVGIAIGAGINYQLTRNVTTFAQKYYQYSYLHKKGGNPL